MFAENDKLQNNDNYRDDEHKQGNPVNSMHITHPFSMRCVGIPLSQIEILSQLP